MPHPAVTSAILALALLPGCGGPAPQPATSGAPQPAASGQNASRVDPTRPQVSAPGSAWEATPANASPWVDPEPAGAQALAESVLADEWNRDKTTELKMEITTLVDRTSGIQGFASALVAKDATLQDRLTRLNAEETATEVIIRLPGSVLFDFDSAAIRPDAERTLQEVAQVLASYRGRPVRLEGHTDAIASEEYNQKLSERRAEAVRDWLAKTGVEPTRLTTRGFGKSHPIAKNTTSEGRQRNRRVEVVIEKAKT